jgi:hypothetical protein
VTGVIEDHARADGADDDPRGRRFERLFDRRFDRDARKFGDGLRGQGRRHLLRDRARHRGLLGDDRVGVVLGAGADHLDGQAERRAGERGFLAGERGGGLGGSGCRAMGEVRAGDSVVALGGGRDQGADLDDAQLERRRELVEARQRAHGQRPMLEADADVAAAEEARRLAEAGRQHADDVAERGAAVDDDLEPARTTAQQRRRAGRVGRRARRERRGGDFDVRGGCGV